MHAYEFGLTPTSPKIWTNADFDIWTNDNI